MAYHGRQCFHKNEDLLVLDDLPSNVHHLLNPRGHTIAKTFRIVHHGILKFPVDAENVVVSRMENFLALGREGVHRTDVRLEITKQVREGEMLIQELMNVGFNVLADWRIGNSREIEGKWPEHQLGQDWLDARRLQSDLQLGKKRTTIHLKMDHEFARNAVKKADVAGVGLTQTDKCIVRSWFDLIFVKTDRLESATMFREMVGKPLGVGSLPLRIIITGIL